MNYMFRLLWRHLHAFLFFSHFIMIRQCCFIFCYNNASVILMRMLFLVCVVDFVHAVFCNNCTRTIIDLCLNDFGNEPGC